MRALAAELRTSARTSAPSGSSATSATVGPASSRWALRVPGVLGEAAQHAGGSLSRSQRETWTTSGASAGSVPSWSSSAARSTRPGVPSGGRTSARARRAVREPGRAEDRARPPRAPAPGSWARRRRSRAATSQSLRLVEPLPGERPAGEDVGVGLLDVRSQERPGPARQLVRAGRAPTWQRQTTDRPGLEHRRDQPGGLRVVEVDDVAWAHECRRARRRSRRARPRRSARSALPERAAVARRTVEVVVDPLRDPKNSASPAIISQRTSTPAPRA